jgi:hypothetical protein
MEPIPDQSGEYETFGDDERLAREHAEKFSEDYLDVFPSQLEEMRGRLP